MPYEIESVLDVQKEVVQLKKQKAGTGQPESAQEPESEGNQPEAGQPESVPPTAPSSPVVDQVRALMHDFSLSFALTFTRLRGRLPFRSALAARSGRSNSASSTRRPSRTRTL